MTMHDERWTLGVAENGDVRLRDLKTGETWRYGGQYALTDAIGKLADWREDMLDNADSGATEPVWNPIDDTNPRNYPKDAPEPEWKPTGIINQPGIEIVDGL